MNQSSILYMNPQVLMPGPDPWLRKKSPVLINALRALDIESSFYQKTFVINQGSILSGSPMRGAGIIFLEIYGWGPDLVLQSFGCYQHPSQIQSRFDLERTDTSYISLKTMFQENTRTSFLYISSWGLKKR